VETRNQKPYGRNYEKTLTDISLRWNFLGEMFTALLGLGGIVWMDFFLGLKLFFWLKVGPTWRIIPRLGDVLKVPILMEVLQNHFFFPACKTSLMVSKTTKRGLRCWDTKTVPRETTLDFFQDFPMFIRFFGNLSPLERSEVSV